MSRTTRRISTKAPGHIKAQRATRGAPAKARKAMGKSFRLSPPGFTQSFTPRISHLDEWIELGYPQGPEVDPVPAPSDWIQLGHTDGGCEIFWGM